MKTSKCFLSPSVLIWPLISSKWFTSSISLRTTLWGAHNLALELSTLSDMSTYAQRIRSAMFLHQQLLECYDKWSLFAKNSRYSEPDTKIKTLHHNNGTRYSLSSFVNSCYFTKLPELRWHKGYCLRAFFFNLKLEKEKMKHKSNAMCSGYHREASSKGNECSFSLSYSEAPGTERSLLYQEMNGFIIQL